MSPYDQTKKKYLITPGFSNSSALLNYGSSHSSSNHQDCNTIGVERTNKKIINTLKPAHPKKPT